MSRSRIFLDALVARRSCYSICGDSSVNNVQIQEIISTALLYVPSAFNSQTTRIILLLSREHERLWEITAEVLRPLVPDSRWTGTKQKLENFKRAHGTVSNSHIPVGSTDIKDIRFFSSKTPELLKAIAPIRNCRYTIISLLPGRCKQTQCTNMQVRFFRNYSHSEIAHHQLSMDRFSCEWPRCKCTALQSTHRRKSAA